jgi:hypothetical protein
LVQEKPESYKLLTETKVLPVYIAHYDPENLYYIPPADVQDTGGKFLRYVEIPTILMDSEMASVYKFQFKRHPQDEFGGGTFNYETDELISGQPGKQEYYEWLSETANQESYGIYVLWKTEYPKISWENIKHAFIDPKNVPSLEELKIMNDQNITFEEAMIVNEKNGTAALVAPASVQLHVYLESQASDPLSVYNFLTSISTKDWTQAVFDALWDEYNIWRESKGLLPVTRDIVEQGKTQSSVVSNPSQGSNSTISSGQPLIPTSTLFGPLYKKQEQAFESQFHLNKHHY